MCVSILSFFFYSHGLWWTCSATGEWKQHASLIALVSLGMKHETLLIEVLAYWSSYLLKPYVASSFCIEVHLFRSSKVIWGISAQSCKYEMKVCCYVLHVHRAATYSLSLRVFSLHFAECWEVFSVDIFDLKWIIVPSNQLLRFCLPFCRWTPRPVTYWTTCRWSWTTYWMNSAAHLGTGSLILTPQDTHAKLNNS